MTHRAFVLLGTLMTLILGGGVARWHAWHAAGEDVFVLGSREPTAVGDTATLCAIAVSDGRWALFAEARRVQRESATTVRTWPVLNARDVCRPVLRRHGVRADTLAVVRRPWWLTAPQRPTPAEARL